MPAASVGRLFFANVAFTRPVTGSPRRFVPHDNSLIAPAEPPYPNPYPVATETSISDLRQATKGYIE